MKAEIKQLRQLIARTSNEIYRRKQQRKGTPKEKRILKQLKETMNETKLTTSVLTKQEAWIDKLRCKRVKLVKMMERGKMIIDDNILERDHKNFFKRIEDSTEYEGAMAEIDKFIKFWVVIWEKDDRKPNMSWMEKIQEKLKEKITSVTEFEITENGLISEIKNKNTGQHQEWMEFNIFGGKGLDQHKKH